MNHESECLGYAAAKHDTPNGVRRFVHSWSINMALLRSGFADKTNAQLTMVHPNKLSELEPGTKSTLKNRMARNPLTLPHRGERSLICFADWEAWWRSRLGYSQSQYSRRLRVRLLSSYLEPEQASLQNMLRYRHTQPCQRYAHQSDRHLTKQHLHLAKQPCPHQRQG
jgi:hypothetical protein